MGKKLIMVFSLLALVTVLALSFHYSSSEMTNLENTAADNLTAVGTKMISEFEQTVKLMDYAAESLTSDINFMDYIYRIAEVGNNDGEAVSQVTTQTMISSILYRAPASADFYRINVFNRSGFFISSRFEKNDTFYSFSDEVREIIDGLNWLDASDKNFSHFTLLPPHGDYWTNTHSKQVFSLVRSLVWHGTPVGYLEISMPCETLESVFTAASMTGLSVQAIFDEGDVLYKAENDMADYANFSCQTSCLTRYPDDDAHDRLVIKLRSEPLRLNVFVAQDISVHNESAGRLIQYNLVAALIILSLAVLVVIILSLSLTGSIRRLTKKANGLRDEEFASGREFKIDMVTSRRDREIFDLEVAFNDLLLHLHRSMKNEIATRQLSIEAQLNALQAQINPHFIYNTLNIVSAKAMESGNDEIINICSQFADMLRYSTDLREKTATLGEELHHVGCYLMLAKARYEDGLQYAIDVPEVLYSLILPKLALQPIVENCFSHGRTTRVMHIEIIAKNKDGRLCLIIKDDGAGFPADVLQSLQSAFRNIEKSPGADEGNAGGHIGLVNTYMRLFYHSKGKMRMQVYNNGGAVVEMIFPASLKEERHV